MIKNKDPKHQLIETTFMFSAVGFKKCTCCKNQYPKTTDYFRKRGEKNNNNYFRSECKKCFDEKSRKRHIEFYKNNTEKEKERRKYFYYRDLEYTRNKQRESYLKNIESRKAYDKKRINELTDTVVLNRLVSQSSLNRNEIPKEIIETKRLLIKLKRTLKNNNYGS